MIVTLVHVHVKPEHIDAFIRTTSKNHFESVKETGNLRFDMLQNAADPSKFVLYEAYKDEESAAAHKKTAHYLKWRDAVADWMATPREGVKYTGLFPQF
jgi:autoinducer 2-degrading protein